MREGVASTANTLTEFWILKTWGVEGKGIKPGFKEYTSEPSTACFSATKEIAFLQKHHLLSTGRNVFGPHSLAASTGSAHQTNQQQKGTVKTITLHREGTESQPRHTLTLWVCCFCDSTTCISPVAVCARRAAVPGTFTPFTS